MQGSDLEGLLIYHVLQFQCGAAVRVKVIYIWTIKLALAFLTRLFIQGILLEEAVLLKLLYSPILLHLSPVWSLKR